MWNETKLSNLVYYTVHVKHRKAQLGLLLSFELVSSPNTRHKH